MPKGLSERDLEDRRHRVGASDANTIMLAPPEDVQRLLEIKLGAPYEDLSDNLAVQMGIETEDLNRRWFTRKTGRTVTNAGEVRQHRNHEWMVNTLDGLTTTSYDDEAILEAKHTSERCSMYQLVERYYPQLQYSMFISNLSWSVLSVFFGNGIWQMEEIEIDPAYCEDRLIPRLSLFWKCKTEGSRWPYLDPEPNPDIARILKISKPVDMSDHNEWAVLAPQWLRLRSASREFKIVSDRLKELVNPEVRRSYGRGVIAKVDKRGIVSLSEDPNWVEQDEVLAPDDGELTY